MPPAKKRKVNDSSTTMDSILRVATTRSRRTPTYTRIFQCTGVVAARHRVRSIGFKDWYCMKKPVLVSILTVNIMASRIQRLYRSKHTDDDRGGDNVCVISLVKMSELKPKNRYTHTNHWFDKRQLIKNMRTTYDFNHPITRIEFTKEEVRSINPSLLRLYRDRIDLRRGLATDLENIQFLENELEDLFRDLVEAACEVRSRYEFSLVFRHIEGVFEQSFSNLAILNTERAKMVVKSLKMYLGSVYPEQVMMSNKRHTVLVFLLDRYEENYECYAWN